MYPWYASLSHPATIGYTMSDLLGLLFEIATQTAYLQAVHAQDASAVMRMQEMPNHGIQTCNASLVKGTTSMALCTSAELVRLEKFILSTRLLSASQTLR